MREGPDISRLGAVIGDPARAAMLSALMGGVALTAGELAREAGIAAPTASGHLARLVEEGLVDVAAAGRHRYYRLAGPDIAASLEALMVLAAATGHTRTRPGPRDAAMRAARVCYDHLAGVAGVRLYAALIARGELVASPAGLALTPAGRARFGAGGLDLEALEASRRPLCRACLDWSERRPHLAGGLGAAFLASLIRRGDVRRDATTRALSFTPAGARAFAAFVDDGQGVPVPAPVPTRSTA